MKNKVLVVEDNEAVAGLYGIVCPKAGADMVAIEEFTLQKIENVFISYRDEIRCVICDGSLPSISGVEVVELIRSLDANIPIFAITAESGLGIEMVKKGANEFLVKPVSVVDLMRILKC